MERLLSKSQWLWMELKRERACWSARCAFREPVKILEKEKPVQTQA